jgi:surface antigen
MRKLGARLTGAVLLATMILPASAANAQGYLQCVPFARMISGIDLFGRAASWWHQAVGRYEQGSLPKAGAVLVFRAISSMRSGHVATVSRVISERIIEVTHANWSVIRGRRGQIERNVQVVDVSPGNDWSQVRVWWAPHQGLGTRNYPTYGFIYGSRAAATTATPANRPARPMMTAWKTTPSPMLRRATMVQPAAYAPVAARPTMVTIRPPTPTFMPAPKPLPYIAPPAPAAAPAPQLLALN